MTKIKLTLLGLIALFFASNSWAGSTFYGTCTHNFTGQSTSNVSVDQCGQFIGSINSLSLWVSGSIGYSVIPPVSNTLNSQGSVMYTYENGTYGNSLGSFSVTGIRVVVCDDGYFVHKDASEGELLECDRAPPVLPPNSICPELENLPPHWEVCKDFFPTDAEIAAAAAAQAAAQAAADAAQIDLAETAIGNASAQASNDAAQAAAQSAAADAAQAAADAAATTAQANNNPTIPALGVLAGNANQAAADAQIAASAAAAAATDAQVESIKANQAAADAAANGTLAQQAAATAAAQNAALNAATSQAAADAAIAAAQAAVTQAQAAQTALSNALSSISNSLISIANSAAQAAQSAAQAATAAGTASGAASDSGAGSGGTGDGGTGEGGTGDGSTGDGGTGDGGTGEGECTGDDCETDTPTGSFNDGPSANAKSFIESEYPDGIGGIMTSQFDTLKSGTFYAGVSGFIVSGTAATVPVYNICFNLGKMGNYGCHNLSVPAEIWNIIRVMLMIITGFACRKIILGG